MKINKSTLNDYNRSVTHRGGRKTEYVKPRKPIAKTTINNDAIAKYIHIIPEMANKIEYDEFRLSRYD